MRRDTRITRMMETNQQYKDRRSSEVRLAFERKIVRKFLDVGGMNALQRRVLESQWARDENIDYYMTFGWLAEEFPNFPYTLVSAETTWQPRALEIFNPSSRSSKIWRLWDEMEREFSKEAVASAQIALIVKCSQESGLSPAMVIHNGTTQDGPFEKRVINQVRVRLLDPRTQEPLFLQHLNYFAAQVALQWQA